MNPIPLNIPKKIVWLASYPKSGNTWFRAFLTALMGNGELNINEMKTDGIFSSRNIFNEYTDLDSTYLTDEEVKVLQPEVFCNVAATYEKERLFVKIHDAYTFNQLHQPIVPTAPSICALYFIRNPLDIAGSLASHNGSSVDEAIKLMNNKEGCLVSHTNRNTKNQFRQLMKDWSGHVLSWTQQNNISLKVIRYEDMISNTLAVFTQAVHFMGITASEERILKAIAETSFDKLKNQEKEHGFKEKSKSAGSFFRNGTMGNWEKELNINQIKEIKSNHSILMQKYNYI